MREREVRLKEKAIDGGQVDSDLNVTIIEKETRDSEHGEGD